MTRRTFLKNSLCAAAALTTSGYTIAMRTGEMAFHPDTQMEQGFAPVPALPPGGVIGVIAPAGPVAGMSEDVIAWLTARGYRPYIFPGVREETGYLAGADHRRLTDLHDAFSNQEIEAIICLRGGYGSMRLLDRINFQLIRANPKPFVGYSDITALHLAFMRYVGFVTFHGPMLTSDFLLSKIEPTESALFAMLHGQINEGAWLEHPITYPLTTVQSGIARGRLVGGNLAMICATIGTPYEIETQHTILFLEEVDRAPPYRIDRMLTQLRLAGKYQNLRGVLIGGFDELKLNQLMPLLEQEFKPLNIPILAGWRSGHCNPNLTLPLGAVVTLDAKQQRITLEQAIVETARGISEAAFV